MTYATILDEVFADLGYNREMLTDATFQRLESYVESAQSYITNVAGVAVDFNTDLLARRLVIAYCRYANAHCEYLFPDNYRSDLLELNCKYAEAGDGNAEE